MADWLIVGERSTYTGFPELVYRSMTGKGSQLTVVID